MTAPSPSGDGSLHRTHPDPVRASRSSPKPPYNSGFLTRVHKALAGMGDLGRVSLPGTRAVRPIDPWRSRA